MQGSRTAVQEWSHTWQGDIDDDVNMVELQNCTLVIVLYCITTSTRTRGVGNCLIEIIEKLDKPRTVAQFGRIFRLQSSTTLDGNFQYYYSLRLKL